MLKAVEETFLGQILFGNSYIFGDLASEKKSKFLKSQIYYIFSRGGGGGLSLLFMLHWWW